MVDNVARGPIKHEDDASRTAPQANPGGPGGVDIVVPVPVNPGPPQPAVGDIERIVRDAVEGRSTYHMSEQMLAVLNELRHDISSLNVKVDELRSLVTPAVPEPAVPVETAEVANGRKRSTKRNTK